jgi:hypothetical protein
VSQSWECPKCQTLNAFGDHCYSCGTAKPDAPPEAVAPPEPVAAGWEPAAAIDLAPDAMDLEPHPCWCHLVKGPHDTRDHPASAMARPESADDLQADAHLEQLGADLGLLTHDWTDPTVKRSYDSGDDGEQQYEDEAMLFEEHGYTKWVDRPHDAISATYTLGDGLPDQP